MFRQPCYGLIRILTFCVVFGTAVHSHRVFAICLDPPGDVTGDGLTSVVDVQCNILLNLWTLAAQTDDPPPCVAKDAIPNITPDHNCDSVVNVADTLLAVTFALKLSLAPELDQDSDSCVDACQTDFDGDGDLDFTDCAPMDPYVGKYAVELCNGYDDDCDWLVDEAFDNTVNASCDNQNVCDGLELCGSPGPAQGVVIHEVMIDPEMVGDGAGEWIELLNTAAVVAIFTFLGHWNDFLWPLIVTNSDRVQTLQVGLSRLSQLETGADWGGTMSGAALASIPMLIVFLFFQKQIISGMKLSGLKG